MISLEETKKNGAKNDDFADLEIDFLIRLPVLPKGGFCLQSICISLLQQGNIIRYSAGK
jgi:hypothetical protein